MPPLRLGRAAEEGGRPHTGTSARLRAGAARTERAVRTLAREAEQRRVTFAPTAFADAPVRPERLTSRERALRSQQEESHHVIAGRQELAALAKEIRAEVEQSAARLTRKGQPVPPGLWRKAELMEEVATYQSEGLALPVGRLAELHDGLLSDLAQGQLTRMRDALVEAHSGAGRHMQLPRRRLPGLPATQGELSTLLTHVGGQPTTVAQAAKAQQRVLDRLFGVRAQLAQCAPIDRAALGRLEQVLDAEALRLTELKRQLATSGAQTQLPVLPSSLKEALRQRDQLDAEVKEVSAALQDPRRAAEHGALKERLAGLGERQRALAPVVEQHQLMQRQGGLARTSGTVGVIGGKSFVPGLVAAYVEPGIKIGRKGVHTGQREVEPYVNSAVSTPVFSAGAFWSPTMKGPTWSVSAPFFGFGSHPMMGKTAFAFVPGLFSVQVGSAGTFNLALMTPLPFPRYFGGLSFMVSSPGLARFTGPTLTLLQLGLRALARPLTPIAVRAGTLIRPLRPRATAA